MRIRITKPGIYGVGGPVPVGTEFDVKAEPVGWAGRYEIITGSTAGKTAVTNPKDGAVQEEDLSAIREEYAEKVGKKPYHGWDAATLREKIAEAEG